MSRNTAKGTMAETAAVNFLNQFYPDDQAEVGLLWSRARSKGSQDEGDVFGPYTAIEVKNRPSTNPITSPLLANAEWKASNAGRRFWMLLSKPKGLGERSIGRWPVATNVESAIKMFSLPLTVDEVAASAREGTTVTAVAPPVHGDGAIEFVVHGSMGFTGLWPALSRQMDEDSQETFVSAMVFPRKTGGVTAPEGQWFFCSNLDNFAYYLQLAGVLPRPDVG